MPVYNAQDTILDAIDSVFRNDFKDLELIVINDGSTDGTALKLASVSDSRCRIIHQTHQGVVSAHNHAVREARAQWIARMDADDLASPDRFSSQWDLVHRKGLELVGGMVQIVGLDGRPAPGMQRYEKWLNQLTEHATIMDQRFIEMPMVNPSLFGHRRWFAHQCREGPFPEDYDWFLRIANFPSLRVGKVSQTILKWRDNPNRATRQDQRYRSSAFDDCKQQHLLEGPLKHHKEVLFWGAGQAGKPWIRRLLGLGYHIRIIIDVHPGKIGQVIHGAEVKPPTFMRQDTWPGVPLLAAVGTKGAREKIRHHLCQTGGNQGRDVWFLA